MASFSPYRCVATRLQDGGHDMLAGREAIRAGSMSSHFSPGSGRSRRRRLLLLRSPSNLPAEPVAGADSFDAFPVSAPVEPPESSCFRNSWAAKSRSAGSSPVTAIRRKRHPLWLGGHSHRASRVRYGRASSGLGTCLSMGHSLSPASPRSCLSSKSESPSFGPMSAF